MLTKTPEFHVDASEIVAIVDSKKAGSSTNIILKNGYVIESSWSQDAIVKALSLESTEDV